MPFLDLLRLSLRNLREAKLRATLTSMGVIVGVAVIVTMVSFGLGLQRNLLSRFKALDLFNEMTVFGKSLAAAAGNLDRPSGARRAGGDNQGPRLPTNVPPSRILDDAAIAEIAKLPGVSYVEPFIGFSVECRSNGHVFAHSVAGASVPNASSRFKEFAAGQMISAPHTDEAIISEETVRISGYASPAEAIGKTLEFLAPPDEKEKQAAGSESESFFGLPLGEEDQDTKPKGSVVVARTFRIVGVLADPKQDGRPGPSRGLMPTADIYVPLPAAHQWANEHLGEQARVIMALAREKGAIGEDESPGYFSAVVRVNDPVALTDVRKRLTDLGLGSFSIVDQLDQIRTVFLIINSVLGLLGGISLLVASFGIANTMIMSILERTREIGIMKAIGAEDREIKLIFFFEAAGVGVTGGLNDAVAAWGIRRAVTPRPYPVVQQPPGASVVGLLFLTAAFWVGGHR